MARRSSVTWNGKPFDSKDMLDDLKKQAREAFVKQFKDQHPDADPKEFEKALKEAGL